MQKETSEAGPREAETRESYQGKMEARLQVLGAELDKLRAKAARVGDNSRQEYDKQIAALQQKQDEARDNLKKLQHSSDEAWKEMSNSVERAWGDLATGIERALNRFK
jgi:ribosome recycling factor